MNPDQNNPQNKKLRILSLSLDPTLLNPTSQSAERTCWYGDLLERYDVIVPAQKGHATVKLSSNVTVYGISAMFKFRKLTRIRNAAKKLLAANGGHDFDLITVQDPYFLGLAALHLSRSSGVPFEVQVHGFEKLSGARKSVAKLVLQSANGVRVVSQRLKRIVMSDFGVSENKITVVPIYSDLSKISLEKPAPKNSFIFLTMSRLVPEKNISLQLRVFAQMKERMQHAELWIVGDGPLRASLERESAKLELTPWVTFVGWAEYPNVYYTQVDTLLLTSRSEGWGMVVVEAAAHALPIIMTDVGCAGELIVNGENGFVIPTENNEAALAKAMLDIYQGPVLRAEFGKKAREAVLKLPSKEETLKLYEQGWRNAIGANGANKI